MMDDPTPMPFNQLLLAQRGGVTHSELTDALGALVAAVVETKKAGTMTLTLKVRPSGTGDGRSVLITDVITTKAPVGERAAAFFFADEDGHLSRTDPRQPELPLREAQTPQIREA